MTGRDRFWLCGAALAALVSGAGVAQAVEPEAVAAPGKQLAQAVDQATLMREGAPLFTRNCVVCHGDKGQGGAGPTLVNNMVVSSSASLLGQIFNGFEERGMPPFKGNLNDRQAAALATFVRNSFGNSFGPVSPDEAKAARP